MNKVVKIIQILAFCISGFEILAFGIFISLYLANIRELQTILSIETIAYIAIGVVVLNLISIGVYIFLIAHFKQKNDLLTSRIVGQASGEAYIFAKLGFIVIDDKNQVIWASELFNQLDLNLIGENVFEWKEELKEFLDIKAYCFFILNVIKLLYSLYRILTFNIFNLHLIKHVILLEVFLYTNCYI